MYRPAAHKVWFFFFFTYILHLSYYLAFVGIPTISLLALFSNKKVHLYEDIDGVHSFVVLSCSNTYIYMPLMVVTGHSYKAHWLHFLDWFPFLWTSLLVVVIITITITYILIHFFRGLHYSLPYFKIQESFHHPFRYACKSFLRSHCVYCVPQGEQNASDFPSQPPTPEVQVI